jgi:uncharacterized membrane protein YfcA
MTWFFTLCILAGSLLARSVGALVGMGGGIILSPKLILLFHVNPHHAVNASLVSVIAISSGGAVAYIRERYTYGLNHVTALQRDDHDKQLHDRNHGRRELRHLLR